MTAELVVEPPFRLGAVEVDPPRRLLRAASGGAQRVEPKVMQVLVLLARSDGALLSRDDLRRTCWDGRATSDDAVDRVIAGIRRLGAGPGAGSFGVETVPKLGYRLWPAAVPLARPARAEPLPAQSVGRRFPWWSGLSCWMKRRGSTLRATRAARR